MQKKKTGYGYSSMFNAYAGLAKYTPDKRYMVMSSVILAFVAVGTVFMALSEAVDKRSVVHHQMHVLAGGEYTVPKSYWTLDWMMQPTHHLKNGLIVLQDSCQDKEKYCNPREWQTKAICEMTPDQRLFNIKNKDIRDDEPYLYPHLENRKKSRNIKPKDTCHAEKIGDYRLWQNNEESWSLGSTHNVFVLVSGVFAVLALISLSSFLHVSRVDDTETNQIILSVFVAVYLTLAYFWVSASSIKETPCTDCPSIHRPMGMASFFYAGIALVASLYVFNGTGVIEDDKKRAGVEDSGDSTENEPLKQRDDDYNVKEHFLNQSHSEMTVRGFLPSNKISLPSTGQVGARLKPSYGVGKVGMDGCGCMHKPEHSKFVYAQLFVMPLVFVILVIHKNNYGLDTTTQIVALLALTVSLLDCFLYRLWWAFNVHKSMGIVVKSDYGDTVHEEYIELMVISVLVVLVQVTVYVYYLLSELFHDDVYWILILVIVFSTIVKLVAVMSIYNNRDEEASPKYTKFNDSVRLLGNADYMLFLLFNILLWLVVYVELVGMKAEHPKMLAPDQKLTTLWGSGWREFEILP